jgi:hypothetical protein
MSIWHPPHSSYSLQDFLREKPSPPYYLKEARFSSAKKHELSNNL